jgi:hypothetical protein
VYGFASQQLRAAIAAHYQRDRREVLSRSGRLLLVLMLAHGGSCKDRSSSNDPQIERAEFGLFFGGQIQQRTELPLELDSTRQTQGFRLVFDAPASRPVPIEWTLNYPTERVGPRGPSSSRRAERTERAVLPVGGGQFEQLLALRSSDVPGTYNIRIRVADDIVLDRPFRLVPKQPLDED